MCHGQAKEEDVERSSEIINELIEDKELDKFKAFTKENKENNEKKAYKRAAAAEAEEAEEATGRDWPGLGQDSLRDMVLARQANRGAMAENFLDGLAEKYDSKKTKKK